MDLDDDDLDDDDGNDDSDDDEIAVSKPIVAKKPTSLGKAPSSQLDARSNLDNCWPENDTLKERFASGNTDPKPKAGNGWVSKKA